MSDRYQFTRRRFFNLCLSAVALIAANPRLLAREREAVRSYHRTRLVDMEGQPIATADLDVGKTYIFSYPYVSTPCFLINLGQATADAARLETKEGEHYVWQGGIGPGRSIVAFSAICAHRMTHPSKSVNFINYRHDRANFKDTSERQTAREQVIYCCSEKSVYDPAQGARVLGGPAPQPLAAVLLDYDEHDGALYATGTLGGEMFDDFFRKFGFRLRLELGIESIDTQVAGTTNVVPLAEYTANQVLCG